MTINISALVFDFGNVLNGVDGSRFPTSLSSYSRLPLDELSSKIRESPVSNDFETGIFSFEEYYEQICRDCKLNIDIKTFERIFLKIFKGSNSLLLDKIKRLKQGGYITGVLSNSNESHATYIKGTCGDRFHEIVLSQEIRARKPKSEAYSRLLERLNPYNIISPSQVLFVDDRSENVQGAIDFGMQGYQFVSNFLLTRKFSELEIKTNRKNKLD